jgi:HPt (histidine-containing phosphotransfer) domain-containing protein
LAATAIRDQRESPDVKPKMSDAPLDSQVLDVEHLRSQTAGDLTLEREVLALFRVQCARLRLLIGGDVPIQRADAAHTLKGSARAIGALRLAALAERLETGLRNGDVDRVARLMSQLDEIIAATRDALARRERAGAA